jgi:hypothetical protein
MVFTSAFSILAGRSPHQGLWTCGNSSFWLAGCGSSTWEANDTQDSARPQREHANSALLQSTDALGRWVEVPYWDEMRE